MRVFVAIALHCHSHGYGRHLQIEWEVAQGAFGCLRNAARAEPAGPTTTGRGLFAEDPKHGQGSSIKCSGLLFSCCIHGARPEKEAVWFASCSAQLLSSWCRQHARASACSESGPRQTKRGRDERCALRRHLRDRAANNVGHYKAQKQSLQASDHI